MVDTDGDESIERAAESTPVEMQLHGTDAAAIQAAVRGLPKEQRQAIDMAFFRGLTHQEIAESLNEPLGTVKARIRRGMLKLREDLQSYL
jgi:RNA polymerase sigma-70 factor (ECF subfamily)